MRTAYCVSSDGETSDGASLATVMVDAIRVVDRFLSRKLLLRVEPCKAVPKSKWAPDTGSSRVGCQNARRSPVERLPYT